MQIIKTKVVKKREKATNAMRWGNTNNIFFGKKDKIQSDKFFPPERTR